LRLRRHKEGTAEVTLEVPDCSGPIPAFQGAPDCTRTRNPGDSTQRRAAGPGV